MLSAWAEGRSVIDAWGTTRAARALDTEQPTTLQRWVAFVRALEPLRALGMDAARESLLTGIIPADIAVMAFDKGAAGVIDRRTRRFAGARKLRRHGTRACDQSVHREHLSNSY